MTKHYLLLVTIIIHFCLLSVINIYIYFYTDNIDSVEINDQTGLDRVLKLLGVPKENLMHTLSKKTILVEGQKVVSYNKWHILCTILCSHLFHTFLSYNLPSQNYVCVQYMVWFVLMYQFAIELTNRCDCQPCHFSAKVSENISCLLSVSTSIA